MNQNLPITITLAPAQPADLDALIGIRLDAMRKSLERIGRFDPQRARERFTSTFDPQKTRHIEVNGQRVGLVVISHSEDALLLDHLYLKPTSQGQGIGSKVLEQLFDQADKAGLQIKVGALKLSDSNRFYERHGFELVESGEFDNYYVRRPVRPAE